MPRYLGQYLSFGSAEGAEWLRKMSVHAERHGTHEAWRLYSRQAHARATNFYEVDLVEALTASATPIPTRHSAIGRSSFAWMPSGLVVQASRLLMLLASRTRKRVPGLSHIPAR